MNKYLVVFRKNVDVDADATTVSAHRFEGWNKDYVFYGHPQFLEEITRAFPRELVRSVELTHFHLDDGITLQEAKRRAGQPSLAGALSRIAEGVEDPQGAARQFLKDRGLPIPTG